jgi:hypothetical protein
MSAFRDLWFIVAHTPPASAFKKDRLFQQDNS